MPMSTINEEMSLNTKQFMLDNSFSKHQPMSLSLLRSYEKSGGGNINIPYC